jgi:hypothetical protein
MNRRSAVVVLSCAAFACAASPGPTPVSPTTFQLRLQGVVNDEDGAPAGGTTITIYPNVPGTSTPTVTATADANGFYDVVFSNGSQNVRAVATKAGYEQDRRRVVRQPRRVFAFIESEGSALETLCVLPSPQTTRHAASIWSGAAEPCESRRRRVAR